MKYLQCRASLMQGEDGEELWLDARGVAECQYDIDGHMGR